MARRPEYINNRLDVKCETLTTSACHDYPRAKSPAHNPLKNNLRDLLEPPGFRTVAGRRTL